MQQGNSGETEQRETRSRANWERLTTHLLAEHEDLWSAVSEWYDSERSGGRRLPLLDPKEMAAVWGGRAILLGWYPVNDTRGEYWTRCQTNHLITIDIPNWFSEHQIRRSERVCESVWLLVTFLHERHLLHFDSDSIDEIRAPLRCYGQLDEDGLPGRAQSVAACRCYWPTDKQLGLGLEENPPEMPDGFDWYPEELRGA